MDKAMTGTVLVTGAAQRIGRQMALELAGNGWAVAVHYNTSQDQANKLVSDIIATGGRAAAVQGDLSASDAPAMIVAAGVAGTGLCSAIAGDCTWQHRQHYRPVRSETESDIFFIHDLEVGAVDCHPYPGPVAVTAHPGQCHWSGAHAAPCRDE